MKDTEQFTEDLKYYICADGDCGFVKNEFNFSLECEFENWNGDGVSFVVSKDGKHFRISVSEENV